MLAKNWKNWGEQVGEAKVGAEAKRAFDKILDNNFSAKDQSYLREHFDSYIPNRRQGQKVIKGKKYWSTWRHETEADYKAAKSRRKNKEQDD